MTSADGNTWWLPPPPPTYPVVDQQGYKRADGLASALYVLLGLCIVVAVAVIVIDVQGVGLIDRLERNPSSVSLEEVEIHDRRAAMVAWLGLIAFSADVNFRTVDDLSAIRDAKVKDVISSGLLIVTGALAIAVVARLTRRQRRLAERVLVNPPPRPELGWMVTVLALTLLSVLGGCSGEPLSVVRADVRAVDATIAADDPEALLRSVNEAMQGLETLTAEADLTVEDVPGGVELLRMTMTMGGTPERSWSRIGVKQPAAHEVTIDLRKIDGQSWFHQASGEWMVDAGPTGHGGEAGEATAVEATDAVLLGTLALDDAGMSESTDGYVITGNLAGPSTVNVELLVDKHELVILEVVTTGPEPRSEWAPFIPAEGADVHVTIRTVVTGHDQDLAAVVAPPDGLVTDRWHSDRSPFELQVPADWEAIPANDLTEFGAVVGRHTDDLSFFVYEEDLAALVGRTTLQDYVGMLESHAPSIGLEVEATDETMNVQGHPAVLMTYLDESGFVRHRDLVMVHDGRFAIIVSIAGPPVPMERQAGLVDFLLNTVLVDEPLDVDRAEPGAAWRAARERTPSSASARPVGVPRPRASASHRRRPDGTLSIWMGRTPW
jgi:hypothetical protein